MSEAKLRVGVRLPPEKDRLGAWLADASAFDAAGAAALWVELPDDSGLDPMVVIAAAAIVTSKAQLVLAIDPAELAASDPRALATVHRLTHDRLTLLLPADPADALAGLEPAIPTLVRAPALAGTTSDAVAPGTVVAIGKSDEGLTERWLAAAPPENRETWAETYATAAAREAAGIVVDAGETLLSLLRNPIPKGDRRDLNIASG